MVNLAVRSESSVGGATVRGAVCGSGGVGTSRLVAPQQTMNAFVRDGLVREGERGRRGESARHQLSSAELSAHLNSNFATSKRCSCEAVRIEIDDGR
jgi:hypothetical protein